MITLLAIFLTLIGLGIAELEELIARAAAIKRKEKRAEEIRQILKQRRMIE